MLQLNKILQIILYAFITALFFLLLNFILINRLTTHSSQLKTLNSLLTTPNSQLIAHHYQTTHYDTTIYKSNNVYIPTPYPIYIDTTPTPEPIEIDTAAILTHYFKQFYYADTLLNDSTALIIIYDTVSNNRITARTWRYQNRRPTVINNFSVAVPKPLRFGLGGHINGNENYFDYGPSATFLINDRHLTGLNYGINQKSIKIKYNYLF